MVTRRMSPPIVLRSMSKRSVLTFTISPPAAGAAPVGAGGTAPGREEGVGGGTAEGGATVVGWGTPAGALTLAGAGTGLGALCFCQASQSIRDDMEKTTRA